MHLLLGLCGCQHTEMQTPVSIMLRGLENDEDTASLGAPPEACITSRYTRVAAYLPWVTCRVNDASPAHPVHAWRRHEGSAPPRKPDVAGDQDRVPSRSSPRDDGYEPRTPAKHILGAGWPPSIGVSVAGCRTNALLRLPPAHHPRSRAD